MFGNCATGRVAMVTAPTITIRMAITIATMGRLMKKFDMDSDSSQSKYFYFAFWLIDPTARLVSSRSKELRRVRVAVVSLASNTLVVSIAPFLSDLAGAQMVWVLRSCQRGGSADPVQPHDHRVLVRLG